MPALILFFLLLLLLPLLFGHILVTSLVKLDLTPDAAIVLIFAILFGALIDIPVRRIARHDEADIRPFAIFGLPQRFPQFRRRLRETIIAVNVGHPRCVSGVARRLAGPEIGDRRVYSTMW